MRLLAFIGIGFGLFVGLILFLIYIGIPTIQDRYLEQETLKSKFNAFSDSLTTCDIEVIPEVLDRLIIEMKFDHLGGGQKLLKTLKSRYLSTTLNKNGFLISGLLKQLWLLKKQE